MCDSVTHDRVNDRVNDRANDRVNLLMTGLMTGILTIPGKLFHLNPDSRKLLYIMIMICIIIVTETSIRHVILQSGHCYQLHLIYGIKLISQLEDVVEPIS